VDRGAGVMDEPKCMWKSDDLDHAVLLASPLSPDCGRVLHVDYDVPPAGSILIPDLMPRRVLFQ